MKSTHPISCRLNQDLNLKKKKEIKLLKLKLHYQIIQVDVTQYEILSKSISYSN